MAIFKEWQLVIIVITFIHTFQYSWCETVINYKQKEKEILKRILEQPTYDATKYPSTFNGTDIPVNIKLNLKIEYMENLDNEELNVRIVILINTKWMDERLKFEIYNDINYLSLTKNRSLLWLPEVNVYDGHNVFLTQQNEDVKIGVYFNGIVSYNMSINVFVPCTNIFKLFPLDHQTCSFQLVSSDFLPDVVINWAENKPLQVKKTLDLSKFTLEAVFANNCTAKSGPRESSCLEVVLEIERNFSYYLIQMYIPSSMLVMVSWLSFWLDENVVPARVSLNITTLLTMVTLVSNFNNSLPAASYIKAIDIWTGVCQTFMFGALLEFALVNYASRSNTNRDGYYKKSDSIIDGFTDTNVNKYTPSTSNMVKSISTKPLVQPELTTPINKEIRSNQITSLTPVKKNKSYWKSLMSNYPTRSKRIDIISRILFPAVFIVFNIFYWPTLLFFKNKRKVTPEDFV